MIKQGSLLLGAHVSTAGGLYRAITEGQELNCNAIQIFTHSSRQWTFKPLADNVIKDFIQAQKNSLIKTVVVHASYLMNPASPEEESRKKSEALLKLELQACEILNIPYLVLHPGSRLTSDITTGLRHCADTIQNALQTTKNVKILIENMAGQGSAIGSTLEELQEIYSHIDDKNRVGFCFDTCHAFAAGYDITSSLGYMNFWKKFDATLGIDNLQVIHMNDSLKPQGSHVDRHTHIGQGKIGIDAFNLIMNDERFSRVCKILETPKGQGLDDDIKNLELLKSLIKK